MLILLRLYLYWSILWGFLAHPDVGLRAVAPMLLTGIDASILLLTLAHASGAALAGRNPVLRRELSLALAALGAVMLYAAAITLHSGGVLSDGLKYLAVLMRPVFLLMSVMVIARSLPAHRAASIERQLRLDLWIVMGAQLVVAVIQLVNPGEGVRFIAALTDTQSATWAYEEGDLPGTFANSIELAYFLLAAYIVLAMPAWQANRIPNLALTLGLGYFTFATGSDAATVCFALYAAYLHLRVLQQSTRRVVIVLSALALGFILYQSLDLLLARAIDKVDNMMLSRLGLLFVSLPGLVATLPAKLISGTGTDFETVAALLQSLPDVPLAFTYEDAAVFINDVFWVALLLALGAPFAALYVWRVARLFRVYLGADRARSAGLCIALLAVIFLAGMLNQILLVRSFTVPLLVGLLPLAMRLQAPAATK